jgi:hypothetical protein
MFLRQSPPTSYSASLIRTKGTQLIKLNSSPSPGAGRISRDRPGIAGGKNQVDLFLSDFPLLSLDKKLTSIPFRVLVGSSTPLHH